MFFRNTQNTTRKWGIHALITVFVVTQVFAFVLLPQQAYAQGAGAVIESVHQRERLERLTTRTLTSAAMGSLIHAASYFTRKLAYDTAVALANSGRGQQSLAFQDGFGTYIQNVALDSAADAISEFGQPFGLNLCQVPDIRIQTFLQIGFHSLYDPEFGGNAAGGPQANCTWQAFKSNWQDYDYRQAAGEAFVTNVSVENSDLGIAWGAIQQIDRRRYEQSEEAKLERLEGEGWKAVKDLISGKITTPASLVGEEATVLTKKSEAENSSRQIAGIYGSGLDQIPTVAASVFLNTLTSEILNRILTDGLFPSYGDGSGTSAQGQQSAALSYFGQGLTQEEDSPIFDRLLAVNPSAQISDYDVLANMVSCPDPSNPGLNNCIIDSTLHQLLARSEVEAISIADALAMDGGLNANWSLLPPTHQEHTDVESCLQGNYCYSNIQKLRKLRILPLGFEIAALRSDPDRPWKLGDVVNGFDDCAYSPNDPTQVIPSADHPFCRLIDPNWLIFVPKAQCETNVNGPRLRLADAAFRQRECVDVSTCLATDASGNCIDYGYCLKEENTWDLSSVDSCDPQFNTCKAYTNASNGRTDFYLARTIDAGVCGVDTVGCRVYSTEQNADGTWLASASVESNDIDTRVVRNQLLHFNGEINTASAVCRADGDGCHAFIPAATDERGAIYARDEANNFVQQTSAFRYLKKAPDYLGCYDVNRAPDSPENNWPETIQQAVNAVANDARCDAYAPVCVEEEVGCEVYTPIDGGAAIPGKIGVGDQCATECIGYETFKQEATVFEKEVFPVYFIPDTAVQCSREYEGCSEFTNLDDRFSGGEQTEYYSKIKYCERPAEDNVSTFFTWEGSSNEGFVIRTHQLKPLTQEVRNQYIFSLEGPIFNIPVFEPGLPGGNGEVAERPVQLEDISSVLAIGSPQYATLDLAELADYAARCNEVTYDAKVNRPGSVDAAEADCQAIRDQNGNIYYRLMSQLISVDEACHPLRKTETNIEVVDLPAAQCTGRWGTLTDLPDDNVEGNVCVRCLGGGEYRNGSCVYWAIDAPNESLSCPAQFNGCRAYRGNTAGNTQEIFDLDFEPVDDSAEALADQAANWSPNIVRAVTEATDVGLHSLRLPAAGARYTVSTGTHQFENGGFYEISFWAKAPQAHNITVRLDQVETGLRTAFTEEVSLGSEWQSYAFGPVELSQVNPEQAVDLVFEQVSGLAPVFYIDHVRLTWIQDLVYLNKDSWNTPLSCDATPNDSFPGEALGCKEYLDSDNNRHNVTGFETLCREKAVGCEPLWDTYNTVSGDAPKAAHLYRAVCVREGDDLAEQACVLSETLDTGCTIPQGAESCVIDQVIIEGASNAEIQQIIDEEIPESAFGVSTVFVPADTDVSTPIFLANQEQYRCDQNQLGCQSVGLEIQTLPDAEDLRSFEHSQVMIKNDPALYSEILCDSETVGCAEFREGNNISYFKDPAITGASFCEYRPASGLNDEFGWFIKDVGRCQDAGAAVCQADVDCNEGVSCDLNADVACYEDYLERNNFYNIYSSGSEGYEGFVGVCPSEANQCTELRDPADTSNLEPDGKRYYVVFDAAVQQKQQACGDQVGLRDGCVLFDKTDEPNKFYNSVATYAASENATPPYSLVPAVREGERDTNIILEVDRARSCGQWLACKTAVTIDGERYCSEYRACDEAGQQAGTCAHWVDDLQSQESQADALLRLTYERYITRGVSWYDAEYSGYALYNKYQIQNLRNLNFLFSGLPQEERNQLKEQEANNYLVRVIDNALFTVYDDGEQFDCIDDETLSEQADWTRCGIDGGGMCYSGQCIYPLGGSFNQAIGDEQDASNLILAMGQLTENSCKGFPQEDTPFPSSVASEVTYFPAQLPFNAPPQTPQRKEVVDYVDGFDNVNVCQDGNCSCRYQRVVYQEGAKEDFYPLYNGREIPGAICIGGLNDGLPCEDNVACAEAGGTCTRKEKVQQYHGLQGFCLEYDFSRPALGSEDAFECLTWLPVQVSTGQNDVFSNNVSAGYNPDIDAASGYGQAYCIASQEVTDPVNNFFLANALVARPGFELRDTPAGESLFAGDPFVPVQEGKAIPVGNDAGDPFLGRCLQEAGDGVMTNFHRYFCGGIEGEQEATERPIASLVQFVEEWSQKHISRNVVPLRVELPNARSAEVNDNGLDPDDRQGLFDTVFNHSADRDQYYVTRNKPCGNGANDACTPHSLISILASNNHAEEDIGLFMHPPRFFPEDDVLRSAAGFPDGGYMTRCPDNDFNVGSECYRLDNHYKYSSNGRMFAPYMHLPGGYMNQDTTRANDPYLAERDNDLVQIDSRERFLRIDQLNRVYFLPIGFPWGAEENMPALFSRDLYIDFLALQENGDMDARTPSYIAYDSDLGSKNYLPYSVPNNNNVEIQTRLIIADNPEGLAYPANSSGYRAGLESYERNKIRYRYQLMHVGRNALVDEGGNIDLDGRRFGQATDPFSEGTECVNNRGPWFALAMDFNEDGEFLGYVSRYCAEGENAGGDSGIQFAVIADMNPYCAEIELVYDDQNKDLFQDTTNHAWTNRVWQFAGDNNVHPWSEQYNMRRNQSYAPYGSIPLTGEAFTENDRSFGSRLRHFFGRITNSGIPYSCHLDDASCALLSENRTGVDADYSSIWGNNETGFRTETVDEARAAIRQLFARVFTRVQLNDVNIDIDNEDLVVPQPPDRNDEVQPGAPRVYSLQLDTEGNCQSDVASCPPRRANTFSINGERYDENTGSVKPIVVAGGAYPAELVFFAHADDNRMPIRRILIDWNEGGQIEAKRGLYKNQKPMCEQSDADVVNPEVALCLNEANNRPTGLTCDLADENACGEGELCLSAEDVATRTGDDTYTRKRFGNIPRACEPGPFVYQHSYNCSFSDIQEAENALSQGRELPRHVVRVRDIPEELRAEHANLQALSPDDFVCEFIPRVQIQDNWGWCSGACINNGFTFEAGCYESCNNPVEQGDNPIGQNPWVSYDGRIIVIPRSNNL